jgi:hypothetical protein
LFFACALFLGQLAGGMLKAAPRAALPSALRTSIDAVHPAFYSAGIRLDASRWHALKNKHGWQIKNLKTWQSDNNPATGS